MVLVGHLRRELAETLLHSRARVGDDPAAVQVVADGAAKSLDGVHLLNGQRGRGGGGVGVNHADEVMEAGY